LDGVRVKGRNALPREFGRVGVEDARRFVQVESEGEHDVVRGDGVAPVAGVARVREVRIRDESEGPCLLVRGDGVVPGEVAAQAVVPIVRDQGAVDVVRDDEFLGGRHAERIQGRDGETGVTDGEDPERCGGWRRPESASGAFGRRDEGEGDRRDGQDRDQDGRDDARSPDRIHSPPLGPLDHADHPTTRRGALAPCYDVTGFGGFYITFLRTPTLGRRLEPRRSALRSIPSGSAPARTAGGSNARPPTCPNFRTSSSRRTPALRRRRRSWRLRL